MKKQPWKDCLLYSVRNFFNLFLILIFINPVDLVDLCLDWSFFLVDSCFILTVFRWFASLPWCIWWNIFVKEIQSFFKDGCIDMGLLNLRFVLFFLIVVVWTVWTIAHVIYVQCDKLEWVCYSNLDEWWKNLRSFVIFCLTDYCLCLGICFLQYLFLCVVCHESWFDRHRVCRLSRLTENLWNIISSDICCLDR